MNKDRYDVVVVGSGVGGLTAAALLAHRGRRVLVLEQHHAAGGNGAAFSRRGYLFDIGLHYIGGCGPGGTIPRILEQAGISDLRFNYLGPVADVFVLPDQIFEVPTGLEGFSRALREAFPRQRRGVERYLRFMHQVDGLGRATKGAWPLLRALPRSLLALRHVDATLSRLLDGCSDDPMLRAVAAGWQLSYALPPSRVSAVLNAGISLHYLEGAYYPAGGGQAIVERLARRIEDAGGEIRTRAKVRRILVEGGRVQGVALEDQEEVRAPVVISNADIRHTLLELVEGRHLPARLLRRVRAFEWPAALAILFLGVKRDLAAEGITGATYSIFPELDVEPCYAAVREGAIYPRPYVTLTTPTLKDPENSGLAPQGVHNVQLMSPAPAEPEHWGVSGQQLLDGSYRSSAEYRRRKDQMARTMLEQAERLLPGLRDQVVFSELATPLTHRRYTNSSAGTGYGIAATPAQFLRGRPGPRTPIEGLVLAGASLKTMHGILGAVRSGLAAADVGSEALEPPTPA